MTNRRSVLVTGARGMLGTDLCQVLSGANWRVIPADLAEFDITDDAATRAFVTEQSPSVVINCAAYTAVDGAEKEPEVAFRVNRDGARNVAAAAAEARAALVQVSTDYVFDGTKATPYVEDDEPHPLNVYGASKLAGEVAAKETLAELYVVRTAWLYGVHGKSFPRTMLRLAQAGKPLRVVDDQVGSPTFTRHLAQALAIIVERPLFGTYHVVNSGACSWHELAKELFRAAGLAPEVTPIPTSAYPLPARRPSNSVLDTSKLAREYGHHLPRWQDAVEEFVRLWREQG